MFKLSLKQLMKLLLITFVLALVLSMVATWMDWRVNPDDLFTGADGTNWSVVWETLSSWLWPLWVMAVALGYVGMMVVRLVRS